MQKKKIFISSVQSEFAKERQILYDYLTTDALLGRFFEPFVFENVPAKSRSAGVVYLSEIEQSDIYIGLFGNEYGNVSGDQLSATEQEFDCASKLNKTRLVFIKGNSENRDNREQKLIQKSEQFIVRQKFTDILELKTAVYASLVSYLEENEYIRTTPFDATMQREATLADIDEEKVKRFLSMAITKRQFPLSADTPYTEVLTRLNLLKNDKLTNAAILLFGRNPQQFFITSEVKCMHFHGTEVMKPIPSYQIYKGDLFEMIERSVDFVLAKIDLRIGLRENSINAPAQYELPMLAIKEAIVNAVCHRDYTSNASVQVMLFKDRLEIWNPGHLPFGVTVEDLYSVHSSTPTNPLIAEPMYLNGTIEKAGTGTNDIVKLCKEAGLNKPEYLQQAFFKVVLYRNNVQVEDNDNQNNTSDRVQVNTQVNTQVNKLILSIENNEISLTEIKNKLQLQDRIGVMRNYIQPAFKLGLIEMTIPDKPNSRLQKYRLTAKGIELKRTMK